MFSRMLREIFLWQLASGSNGLFNQANGVFSDANFDALQGCRFSLILFPHVHVRVKIDKNEKDEKMKTSKMKVKSINGRFPLLLRGR